MMWVSCGSQSSVLATGLGVRATGAVRLCGWCLVRYVLVLAKRQLFSEASRFQVQIA